MADESENLARYSQAMHGVQSAILYEQSRGIAPYTDQARINKDARVGIDSAHVSHGALVELLVEKGLITAAEFEAKLAHYAELELFSYEAKYPGVHFR